MRRREFIFLAGAASNWPFAARGVRPGDPLVPRPSWPNALTTGVSPGTSLQSIGDHFRSSSIGQVIGGLVVSGTIVAQHSGVTIRNCRARGISVNAVNVVVEYCNVVGSPDGNPNSGVGILGGDG